MNTQRTLVAIWQINVCKSWGEWDAQASSAPLDTLLVSVALLSHLLVTWFSGTIQLSIGLIISLLSRCMCTWCTPQVQPHFLLQHEVASLAGLLELDSAVSEIDLWLVAIWYRLPTQVPNIQLYYAAGSMLLVCRAVALERVGKEGECPPPHF